MSMVAPEQALKRTEDEIQDLREAVLLLVEGHPEGVDLAEVLRELVDERGRPVEFVSRALSRLLTSQTLALSAGSRVIRPV